MRSLVDALLPSGVALHLWSLEEPLPALVPWTRGKGLLPKFHSLNRLLPFCADADLIFFIDDDVELPPEFVARYTAIIGQIGAALSQPALTPDSYYSFPHTLAQEGLWARLTNLVESGPVVAMTRAFLDRVTPFPETNPMGWGLEAQWSSVAELHGWRMAIVDACPVRHALRPIGARYSTELALRDMHEFLRARGEPWPAPIEIRRFPKHYKSAAQWREECLPPTSDARPPVTASGEFSLLSALVTATRPAWALDLGSAEDVAARTIAAACRPWWGRAIRVHPDAPTGTALPRNLCGIAKEPCQLHPRWTQPVDFIAVGPNEPRWVEQALNNWVQVWLTEGGLAVFRYPEGGGNRTAAVVRAWLRAQPRGWQWQEFPDEARLGLLWRDSNECGLSRMVLPDEENAISVTPSGEGRPPVVWPRCRPRVSLIIAGYNEGNRLQRTLASCFATFTEMPYEVLVADDASTDGSVAEACRCFPQVQVVGHACRRGTSVTKDLGARASRGDTLLFLDGHCNPEPGALARLVADVEDWAGNGIAIPQVPALDDAPWKNDLVRIGRGVRNSLETFHLSWIGREQMRPRGRFFESPAFMGCCFAVSRDLYDRLWGFDPGLLMWGVEDTDLGIKAWLMGAPILHDPAAVVGHRFQERFDNYTVREPEILANHLRLARKHFTEPVWDEWLARSRVRHPLATWEEAWAVFTEDRASVEREREYLFSRRVHDEFWYAGRFGLPWPSSPQVPRVWSLGPDGFPRDPEALVSSLVQRPWNCREMIDASLVGTAARGGDRLTLYLKLVREHSGRVWVARASFQSEGDPTLRVYGSLLTDQIHGVSVDHICTLQAEDLHQLLGGPVRVVEHPRDAKGDSEFDPALLTLGALTDAFCRL